MRKKLLHNWGLKLASLVLAFVLWFVIVQINDPTETRYFSNIQVKLVNTELLDRENKVYEILDDSDVARRVTVRAPKSIVDKLRSTDIVAEADVSKLTDINTVPITYYVINTDSSYPVESTHNFVQLSVEERTSKYISLVPNIIGEVAEGYTVGNTTLDQNMIEVSGPKSQIDQVARAGVDINVSGASSSLSANVDIQLYDKEHNVISVSSIKKQTDYAHIAVEVLAVKEVPVWVNYSGVPANGYMTTGVISCEPYMVRIAGSSNTLTNITKISIPAERLSIEGAEESVTETVNIREYLPENVRMADSGVSTNVNVTIHIEPIAEKTLSIPAGNIHIVNIPEGLEAAIPVTVDSYSLQVKGLGEQIRPLRAGSLAGSIDVEAWMKEENITRLVPGVYQMPVDFGLSEEITVTVPVTASVTVREEES